MTPQQIEAMKLALDLTTMHYTDDGYAALRAKVRSASKEALAEHAMRETQRLRQEIEQEPKIKTTDPFESSRVADYNRGWNDCLFASGIVKQPEQEPVIDKSAAKRIATTLGWEPKRGWVGAGDLENSNAYLTPPQQEQELVAYAGVKVWVGNQQVVRCLTQTELHYAVEPWLLVELNALKCIASFKEKKT